MSTTFLGLPLPPRNAEPAVERSVAAMPRVAGCNVFVTLSCNLDCPYCYVAKDGRHMDLATADRVVDLMAGFAREREGQFHFGFLGGEPLLRFDTIKYLVENMRAKSGREIAFGLTTNGTVFHDGVLPWLRENDVRVVLSFDGIPEAMSGRPVRASGANSYDRVVAGMSLLQTSGVNYLVQMTVTEDNVKHLARSVVHTLELGNHDVIFGFSLSNSWTFEQRNLLAEQMREVFELYVQIYRQGAGTVFKYLRDEITSYLLFGLTREPETCCSMADQVLAVSIDGELVPCQAFVNYTENAFGSVAHGVDSELLATLRKGRVDELEHCPACVLKGFCRKCPAANYAASGDVGAVTPISCSMAHFTYGLVESFVVLMLAESNDRFLDEFRIELNAREREGAGRQRLRTARAIKPVPLEVRASREWDWEAPQLGAGPSLDLGAVTFPRYEGRKGGAISVGDGRAPVVEFGAYRTLEVGAGAHE